MGCSDGTGKNYENGFGNVAEMKIMTFPVKLDKFTGYFDKFLKIVSRLMVCNTKGYHINMSAAHSDKAAKKVSGTRAFARICARRESAARRILFPDLVEENPAFPASEHARARRRHNQIIGTVVVRVPESEIHDSAAQLPRAPGLA